MILEYKELKYKNKRIFEKLVMTIDFKREPKYFTEKEACFLFLKNGSFQFRTPTQVITYSKNEAMLAKCGDYFIEPEYEIDKSDENTITAIYEDHYGTIWVGTRFNGLNKISFEDKQTTIRTKDQRKRSLCTYCCKWSTLCNTTSHATYEQDFRYYHCRLWRKV